MSMARSTLMSPNASFKSSSGATSLTTDIGRILYDDKICDVYLRGGLRKDDDDNDDDEDEDDEEEEDGGGGDDDATGKEEKDNDGDESGSDKDNNGKNKDNSNTGNDIDKRNNKEDEAGPEREPSDIPACRAILASRSDVFRHMLYGPFREATLPVVTFPFLSTAVLKLVVEYCYTDNVTVSTATSSTSSSSSSSSSNPLKMVRLLVKTAEAASFFCLVGLQTEIGRMLKDLLTQEPSLACVIIDEYVRRWGTSANSRGAQPQEGTTSSKTATKLASVSPRDEEQDDDEDEEESNGKEQQGTKNGSSPLDDKVNSSSATRLDNECLQEVIKLAWKVLRMKPKRILRPYSQPTVFLSGNVAGVFGISGSGPLRHASTVKSYSDVTLLGREALKQVITDKYIRVDETFRFYCIQDWAAAQATRRRQRQEGRFRKQPQGQCRKAAGKHATSTTTITPKKRSIHETTNKDMEFSCSLPEATDQTAAAPTASATRALFEPSLAAELVELLDLAKIPPSVLSTTVVDSGLVSKERLQEAFMEQALLAENQGVSFGSFDITGLLPHVGYEPRRIPHTEQPQQYHGLKRRRRQTCI